MTVASILVCSRDRRKKMETLIHSLLTMVTSHSFEIVVVEETNDPTPIAGVKYVPHPISNRGFPYARNLALTNAVGEIIFFIDDDCAISLQWFECLLKPFEDPSVIGCQGGVSVPESSNAIGWAESMLGFPGGGIRRISQARGQLQETKEISTLNCAYRKWVFNKVGGFDERLLYGGEDYLFAKNACEHGRCVFVPNAMAFHHPRGSLAKIFFWFYRRGRAEFSLALTGWQSKEFISYWLRSSLLLKILLLLILGSLVSSNLSVFCAAFMFYYVAIFLKYFKDCRRCAAPFAAFIILPLVKLVMDLAIDFGRFRSLILKK
jgi:GT2 family glycosyltransferase